MVDKKMNEIPLEDFDDEAAERALDRVAKEMGLVGEPAEAPRKSKKKSRSFSKWAAGNKSK